MSAPAKDRLAAVLSAATAGGAPSAQRSLPTESLRLEVRGVGPVDLPVTPTQAQELAAATRPAKYGQGTETLFDPLVRDTGEVPKSRVRVDRDHWDGALGPVLEGLRDDLGLPSGSRLRADFHSMLVYGPGQFFKPHLDSEKADRMVGSLVVTLPSQFRGGALVVEHGEHRATYRGSKAKLSCVAFYADCRHEIRPVTSGHRIVLTYDLVLRGEHAAVVVPPEPARGHAQVEALAACLAEHFSEAPAPRWRNDHRSSAPPTRLVYLLDHQYTQRSVAWSRLKGDDAARVALLLDAAAQVDCEVALALADIHETRECYDDSWEAYGGRWGGWYEDEEDESESDAGSGGDEGAIAEGELLDWDLSLGHWIDAAGGVAEPIGTRVHDDEVATSTPTSDFEAYESEYQPYMGNWGNTMDRWYRRAAVVIWPRRLDFAVRAEASPAWALGRLAPDGEPVSAEERCAMAVSLAPFWTNVAPKEPSKDYIAALLRAALVVHDPDLASMLLEPHLVEDLAPDHAPGAVALADRYGATWARAWMALWAREPARRGERDGRRLGWLSASEAAVAEALVIQGPSGRAMATAVLRAMWSWTEEIIDRRRRVAPPSARDRALADLAGPMVGVLEGVIVLDDDATADAVTESLVGDVENDDVLMPLLVGILREAERRPGGSALAATLDLLAEPCRHRLEARLERRRQADDWSIPFDGGCGCADCRTLGAFLDDPTEQRREWPLAKPRRQHIHRALDARELPVRHQTRRVGRPYILVLTKTDTLFANDAEERRQAAADLTWLDSLRRS